MGGLIILLGLLTSVILWADLSNINILFCVYVAVSFGLLGAFDDYKKIKNGNSSGISSRFKIITQILLAVIGLIFLTWFVEYEELRNLAMEMNIPIWEQNLPEGWFQDLKAKAQKAYIKANDTNNTDKR